MMDAEKLIKHYDSRAENKKKQLAEITARLISNSDFLSTSGAALKMVHGFLEMSGEQVDAFHAVVVLGWRNSAFQSLAKEVRELLELEALSDLLIEHDDIGAQGHDEDTCCLCRIRNLLGDR